jgi:hypothetical protein
MSAWAVGLAALVAAFLVWRAMGPSARVATLRGLGAGLGALGVAYGVYAMIAGRTGLGLAALIGGGLALAAVIAAGRRRLGGTKGASRVETRLLRLVLDHATGAVGGDILAGPYAGRRLETLTADEVQGLWRYCQIEDEESARLVEAYLEKVDPGWREAAEGARPAGAGASAGSGAMTHEEALAVLGLKAGATAEEVRAAHRRLMQGHHPDKGGNAETAARLNRARDVLLGG